MIDRQEAIEILIDHFENPRHRGQLDDADVAMPGGNPGCGDVIMVYLKGEGEHELAGLTWEGEGCTISQAAASVLAEMIHDEQWSLDDILNLDYSDMIDLLGREVVRTRTRCATLALGTMKAAAEEYRRQERRRAAGIDDEPSRDLNTDEHRREYGIVVGDDALTNNSKACI
jgi:nitrogen fixation NifU-like protein